MKKGSRPTLFFILLALSQVLLFVSAGRLVHIGEAYLDIAGIAFRLPAGQFILLYFSSWFVMGLLFFLFPRRCTFKTSAAIVLFLSIGCRLAVFPMAPSDDINRYLWEGKLISTGTSPYHHAPSSMENTALARSDPFFAGINHKDISAAYPPGILFIFSGISMLSYTPGAIKTAIILFDLASVFLLALLLHQRSTDLRWALLYAVNPLVVTSFAGLAHYDAILVCALLAALFCHAKKWWRWGFFFLGLSIQIKYIGLFALPFFISRQNLKHTWVLWAAVTLPYVPFLIKGPATVFSGLTTFGSDFAFNSCLQAVFQLALGSMEAATQICGILFVSCLGLFYCLKLIPRFSRIYSEPLNGTFLAFGALLVLSPTVHFWYLTWILAFAVLKRSLPWILLTFSMGFYFTVIGNAHHTGQWDYPPVYQAMVWLPFIIMLAVQCLLFSFRLFRFHPPARSAAVSVIIPCQNEADNITPCIRQVRMDPAVREIIVVDAGSADSTVELAQKAGATVIFHHAAPSDGGGRGGQIHAGLDAATADIIAVVHADTLCEPDTFTRISRALEAEPELIGGAYGIHFNSGRMKLSFIEFLNTLRVCLFDISFGDQIQFFRRAPIMEHNIYPAIPLMEDVELSLRLRHFGKQAYLFGSAQVSARRWEKKGVKNALWVISAVVRYLLTRLFTRPDTLRLYHTYYGTRQKGGLR